MFTLLDSAPAEEKPESEDNLAKRKSMFRFDIAMPRMLRDSIQQLVQALARQ